MEFPFFFLSFINKDEKISDVSIRECLGVKNLHGTAEECAEKNNGQWSRYMSLIHCQLSQKWSEPDRSVSISEILVLTTSLTLPTTKLQRKTVVFMPKPSYCFSAGPFYYQRCFFLGASVAAWWVKLLSAMPASHTDSGSCPSSSLSDPTP